MYYVCSYCNRMSFKQASLTHAQTALVSITMNDQQTHQSTGVNIEDLTVCACPSVNTHSIVGTAADSMLSPIRQKLVSGPVHLVQLFVCCCCSLIRFVCHTFLFVFYYIILLCILAFYSIVFIFH